MVEDLEDSRRSEPAFVLAEREMLEAWLEVEHELDDTGLRHGQPCSLRWIYNPMIEEYARHNGHADMIRELVDGKVGW